MSYSSRIYMYGPVGLLLLVVILYSVFWRVEADTLSARLDRANGGEILPGVAFSFEQKSVGGFPFRLDMVMTGVAFSWRNGGTEARWRSDRIALHRLSYGRNRFIFEADGLQSLSWSGRQGGAVETISFTPQTARASAVLAQGRLTRLDLDVWGARGTEANAKAGIDFEIGRAQLHTLARRNDMLDLVLQIENASSANSAWPQVDCRAGVKRADILSGIETGSEGPAAALQRWRDAMGVINVAALTLNWPQSRAKLRGDVIVDTVGQLAGVLRGDVSGKDGPAVPMQLAFHKGAVTLTPAHP